jgi:RHS repeat-associated protein
MRWHWVMVSMAILFLVPMGSAEGAEKVTASGERYVVVLAEEVGETEAARLASVYGRVLEPDGGHGGRKFVVRMASSRARMMSLDPHVVSVSEQTRHLTPLPTGSGSTTLGPYTYDGSGNIRSIGPPGNQEQYVYDALGRLTTGTAGVTNTQIYQYDPFGNRTVVNRTGSNCTGDTACEQHGTYLAGTNHLNNNGAAYNAAGDLTAYVADRYAYDAAGGTPRLVTDGTGLKLATHTYYAFGAELMGTPESPEAGMKFTGHERDITGTSDALDNMHARYYSSLTGRFLSVDPAQSAGVEAPQT